MRHWFWALGGDMGADGRFHLLVAEMLERGPAYLSWTEPIATWNVSIDLADMSVAAYAPASDNSNALYGFSVTSDAIVHLSLLALLPAVRVGPAGVQRPAAVRARLRLHVRTSTSPGCRVAGSNLALEYWNGSTWVTDRAAAGARDPP